MAADVVDSKLCLNRTRTFLYDALASLLAIICCIQQKKHVACAFLLITLYSNLTDILRIVNNEEFSS